MYQHLPPNPDLKLSHESWICTHMEKMKLAHRLFARNSYKNTQKTANPENPTNTPLANMS
jgi:hypothetical protein